MRSSTLGRLLRVTTALIVLAGLADSCQAAPRFWLTTPYRVRVVVLPVGPTIEDRANLGALVRELEERLTKGARPLWDSHVQSGDAEEWRRQGRDRANQPELDSGAQERGAFDKTILLTVREGPLGYTLIATEYDRMTKTWGNPVSLVQAGLRGLGSTAIDAASACFRPLVSYEIDPEQPGLVTLKYRGADLPAPRQLRQASRSEVLIPYLRRVDRDGNVLEPGAERAPWTYLVAETDPERNLPTAAKIVSHRKTPFGTRRRGRIEQIAIAAHRTESATRLALRSQENDQEPLRGYEIFVTRLGEKGLKRIGRTDLRGWLMVPHQTWPQQVHVRCGSSVVASLPVITGVDPEVRVPLLDEQQRLLVEVKLSTLREELVDMVAVRRVLAGRIRKHLERDELEEAEELLGELESMPGMADFSRRINRVEQLYQADHPIVQRKIERVFSETRSVLGKALDPREARELSSEVLRARKESS